MHPDPRERARNDERGSNIVEAALVVPLLLILVFGVIDFGAAFNDWIAMRQGVREGARQAVTGLVGDRDCTVHSTTPPSDEVRALVCMVKDRSDLGDGRTRVKLLIEGDYAQAQGSIVVCSMAELRSITGFFAPIFTGRIVSTSVQMKTEQTTSDAIVGGEDLEEFQENAHDGAAWTFCTAEPT